MTDIAPTRRPRVLKVGLDASEIDFSALPGVTEADVRAGGERADAELRAAGFDVDTCALFVVDTEVEALSRMLADRPFDCIMIGAGLRTLAANTLQFERAIAVVRKEAPDTPLCFNSHTDDTLDAIRRSLAAPA